MISPKRYHGEKCSSYLPGFKLPEGNCLLDTGQHLLQVRPFLSGNSHSLSSKYLALTLENDSRTHLLQTPTYGVWKGKDSEEWWWPGHRRWAKSTTEQSPTGIRILGEEKQHSLVGQRKKSVADTGAERYKNPTKILQAEGKPSTTGFLYYEAAEAGEKSYVAMTERLSLFFLF